LTALSRPQEFNLLTSVEDEEFELRLPSGQVWIPQNYDEDFQGTMDLYRALVQSRNVPAVRIALQVGMPAVVNTLKRLGFQRDALAVPALALGAVDMTPLEVAQLYNSLGAGGFHSPLLSIREVMTKDGRPLNHFPLQIHQAFPEAPVYLLNWAMERVMHHGTGASAYSTLPAELRVAGKTGTTNDLRDSWFAGFAGNRVAVVWVGRDDNQPSKLTGATGALTIWSRIMRDIRPQSYTPAMPDDVELLPFDAGDGDHDDEDCDSPIMVPFIRGAVPEDYAPCEEWSSGEPESDIGGDEDRPRRRKKGRDRDPLDWIWDIFE
jgi:penicillin-binding protein 1B